MVRGPILSLSYSQEHMHPDDPGAGRRQGKRTLQFLSAATGGRQRIALEDVFEAPPGGRVRRSLRPWFLAAALVLVLVEIALRRLGLAGRCERGVAALLRPIVVISRLLGRRRPAKVEVPERSGAFDPASRPGPPDDRAEDRPPPPPPERSVLSEAKIRARKRFSRP